jgi:hypothetical protein
MTMTTIKVTSETRDQLKAQAAAAHLSLGDHLARLADAADRGLRFEALRAAIADSTDELTPEDQDWLDADLGT